MIDNGASLVVPNSGSFGIAQVVRRLDDGLHYREGGTATLEESSGEVRMRIYWDRRDVFHF